MRNKKPAGVRIVERRGGCCWLQYTESLRERATFARKPGRTFTPTEALEGLLLELAERYRHYIETTPWWKVWWHAKRDRQPWLEADWRP